ALGSYVAANGIQQVLVAGHSLGGAMVQDFMAYVAEGKISSISPTMVSGYTWGSPGANNLGLAPTTPINGLVNFVDTLDPVPIAGATRGYVISGTTIFINSPNLGFPFPNNDLNLRAHSIGYYYNDTLKLIDFARDSTVKYFYNTIDANAIRTSNF